MSIHTATSVDFQTIKQPNHTETAGMRAIFTRFRQPLTNIPWGLSWHTPGGRHPRSQACIYATARWRSR